jgi:hypothetical protein
MGLSEGTSTEVNKQMKRNMAYASHQNKEGYLGFQDDEE